MQHRTHLLSSVAATTLVALLFASPVVAQTAAGPGSDAIEEIVVTAQKRSQSLSDVGITVNVVGQQQLAQRGITNPSDLTKVVPGFTVAKNGDGTPIYTLRGVSFNSLSFGTAPTVSVYVDEAPLPFSVMTQGALLDLERVEILKGPQGTLFGQNATGGAINYIAAKPTQDFRAGVDVTYGNFDTKQFNGFVSGGLTDTLSARLALGATRSGPWQKSVTRDDELGDQRKTAGRLLLDWRPNNKLKVGLNLNGWIDRSDTQAAQLVELRVSNPALASPALLVSKPTTLDARSADWDPGQSFRRDNAFYQTALRVDYDLGSNATLTSLTDYTHVRLRNRSEADGTAVSVQTNVNIGWVESFNQEIRLSGALDDARVHYIVGATYQGDKTHQDEQFLIPFASGFRKVSGVGPIDSATDRSDQLNQSYGLFGNLDWNVTSQLALSGGVRKTWIKHKDAACTLDDNGQAAAVFTVVSRILRAAHGLAPAPAIQLGGCVTLGPDFTGYKINDRLLEDNLSWRFNANYKIKPGLLLYATASRGFKAGNYPVLPATAAASLTPVKQERLTAYEGGAKLRLLDNRLSLNAAAYYYDYQDKQLQNNFVDPTFGVLVKYANIPKSTVRGFDVDATFIPVSGLTVRSAVTYADSRVGRFAGVDVFGKPIDMTGKPFNVSPKWTAVNDIEYRKSFLEGQLEGFAGASSTYNSKTNADLAGTPNRSIRAYTIVDLRAGVRAPEARWQLMAFLRNVSNVYTWNYAVGAQDTVIRFAAMPRTYGLTASYNF